MMDNFIKFMDKVAEQAENDKLNQNFNTIVNFLDQVQDKLSNFHNVGKFSYCIKHDFFALAVGREYKEESAQIYRTKETGWVFMPEHHGSNSSRLRTPYKLGLDAFTRLSICVPEKSSENGGESP